jgi:hypothetical protein
VFRFPTSQESIMSTEKLLDRAEYVVGGPLFFGVAAVTGAVMAIGFVVTTGIQRLFNR